MVEAIHNSGRFVANKKKLNMQASKMRLVTYQLMRIKMIIHVKYEF